MVLNWASGNGLSLLTCGRGCVFARLRQRPPPARFTRQPHCRLPVLVRPEHGIRPRPQPPWPSVLHGAPGPRPPSGGRGAASPPRAPAFLTGSVPRTSDFPGTGNWAREDRARRGPSGGPPRPGRRPVGPAARAQAAARSPSERTTATPAVLVARWGGWRGPASHACWISGAGRGGVPNPQSTGRCRTRAPSAHHPAAAQGGERPPNGGVRPRGEHTREGFWRGGRPGAGRPPPAGVESRGGGDSTCWLIEARPPGHPRKLRKAPPWRR